MQLETECLAGERRCLIDDFRIADVLINEAVTTTSCYYYLVLLPHLGEDGAKRAGSHVGGGRRAEAALAMCFPTTRPPLPFLIAARKELKEALKAI